MSESFAELFEESLVSLEMTPGSIVPGIVIEIDEDWVTVHAGLKSEGIIPVMQFRDESGELEIAVGDTVRVAMEAVDDGWGETRLSREKAKRAESWEMLERSYEHKEVVKGVINGRVKGGFTVDIRNVRAFLPGSLVDVRPLRETEHLEGCELEFRVIKLDQKRNNVVVSRRSVLEEENSAEREALLASLQEGQVMAGLVKNLTDYGAFVDLGGVDGLLHITDMAWKRIRHPSEVVNVGDELKVRVLRFDRERSRVSLGLKQLGEDPWEKIAERYPDNSRVLARVTNLTDYGCFAELEEGVEGLVHVSEMDWTNRNIHPSKVVQVGDEVEVMILDVDEERRRISLGIKQCKGNPWEEFAARHNKLERITGCIKSITDFGLFIGLEGDIDGLVHISDISWNEPDEQAVRRFTKGEEIETVLLGIDIERERIRLGLKQLHEDPFNSFVLNNEKGSRVTGVVTGLEAKSATVSLGDEIEGILKASEIARDHVEDVRNLLTEGQKVDVKIISVDRKNKVVGLSMKALEFEDEAEAVRDYQEKAEEPSAPTTVGDLIKQQQEIHRGS